VPTEDLIHMLQRMGWRTEIDLDPLLAVVAEAEEELGRALPGVIHRTGRIEAAGRVPVAAH
jgi:hypothetical protein